jgi:hypothetical protein
LIVVDRAICLPWDHSVDDSAAVPSDIFSSWDTWKYCKLGTSCSIYALDSSRSTPLVEEVLKPDVIHFFSNSNVEGGCLSSMGALLRRNELRCMIRYNIHLLAWEEGIGS